MPLEFDVRPIDLSPSGIREIAAFLKTVWPKMTHFDAAYLNWEYNDNPAGCAMGFNAYCNSQLIAHYANQPFKALVAGKEEVGLLSINMAVHLEHRRRGLFYTVTMRTLEAAVKMGYTFVMAVANAQSTLLFVKLLGFQLVCPLTVKVGIGPIRRQEVREETFYTRLWDEKTLQWRLDRPGQPYRVKRCGGHSVIYAPTGTFGIFAELGMFESQMVPEWMPNFSTCHPLRLWIGLDSSRNWSRSLYADIPMKLRPAPLNFIFKDLTGQKRFLQPDRSHFALIDLDVY